MTPAINLLKKKGISFDVLSYQHEPSQQQFGLEAVEKLNLPAEQVFKTLVLEDTEHQLLVAIVPVSQQVNLKMLAKAACVKKVQMAPQQKVENTTGYILGGVSPLGQKKRLVTYVHESAQEFDVMYVSAGKRGLEIALSPQDLCSLLNAKFANF
ncbi:Cys-tRNA(Pro) deacylase [Pseudoalteromonas shioyasakiensis]|uniref:Cys-tRNA(Pro) deacylase n=1 Tax=Pseudoalteromonas TaxID=53246 RepID=UPI000C9233FF|nr:MULTISPECIES: Cys-tRNA(Pro) deacylase [Pseudoalteromonas]MAD03990.1 Cys-tRNA(Pro) deacylase [Pseudoalteromonas sp.]MCQ8880830.1 Cys-tRNA(Pro) deacylase [Pseudoalteromonas shioyasakiensis]QWV07080.1 Cys-tRNA(Pro) deacylase [Pseudoalteromonas shioyasakiensis]URQ92287.1 Cys-tRNA(Pro) deacylase [Pseudoalteromonas sp. SCSIO 43101]|tara:strand:+ start:16977 stop:17438 length:462 start_codon:yes stop_codon:yes gene_type:complete